MQNYSEIGNPRQPIAILLFYLMNNNITIKCKSSIIMFVYSRTPHPNVTKSINIIIWVYEIFFYNNTIVYSVYTL